MNSMSPTRVRAVHHHWSGTLRLSNVDDTVVHEGPDSKGRYRLSNGVLTVHWENFSPEIFIEISGLFVEDRLIREFPRLDRLFGVMVNEKPLAASKIHVVVPENNYEIMLRLQTSDVPTFFQIFGGGDYESPNLPASASTIVDLGANIGLTTVFFGLKYPSAKILSVEPEVNNYASLVGNTNGLGPRVQRQHAAVWMNDGLINIHLEDDDGRPLGFWGVQTSGRQSKYENKIKCYKMETLLEEVAFGTVDILKVDIEGAELELFSHDVEKWLPRINLIIIETHDRFRPGAEEAVRNAVHAMFEELPRSGENLFFRRR